MEHGIITVSHLDKVILEEKKCRGIYKVKEGNSVKDGVSMKKAWKGDHFKLELQ